MYKDKIALNPDYDKYLDMDNMGLIHTVTVRDDNKLVGYYISFIMPNMHYKDHTYALNDVLFLEESYRKTGTAVGLFTFTEECLKDMGVSVMAIHMKTALPFDSLCEYLNYDYAERLYMKFIGE